MNSNNDPDYVVGLKLEKFEYQPRLHRFGVGMLSPIPIVELFLRMEILLDIPSISTMERCEIVDRRKDVSRLLKKSKGRLADVIREDPLADPVIRPTVDEAIASDDTADALGAFLRTSEWIRKLEHRYLLGLEHRHLPWEDI